MTTYLQRVGAEQVLEEEGLDLPIGIRHSEDAGTRIGDRLFKLIFPKFMLNYECDKDINILFMGLVTENRQPFFKHFNGATIIDCRRGRDDHKIKDEDYFRMMSRAKFVLCPDGDFIWTYRFFESLIFKAIPIIEHECSLYDGFKFLRADSNLEYNIEWVNHNYNKVRSEMFWG